MARHYGLEPENAVKFNFDEEEVNVFQRLMVKFFTSSFFTKLDVYCVRYFGGSVSTRLTSFARDIAYQRTLVLKTIGSKTGQVRTCALPYVMDEGRYCIIGGAANFAGHLTIADRVTVSGGTSITKSITKPGGHFTSVFPFMPHGDWERNAAIVRGLTRMRERLQQLEQRVKDLQQQS